MRITKKFAGASCIGKQVFQPCRYSPQNIEAMRHANDELNHLEQVFIGRINSKAGFGAAATTPDDDSGLGTENVRGRKRGRSIDSSDFRLSKKTMSVPNLATFSSVGKWKMASDVAAEEEIPTNTGERVGRGFQLRSQSALNLESYSADDQAAGDLLLQFFLHMHQQLPSTSSDLQGRSRGNSDQEMVTQHVSWTSPLNEESSNASEAIVTEDGRYSKRLKMVANEAESKLDEEIGSKLGELGVSDDRPVTSSVAGAGAGLDAIGYMIDYDLRHRQQRAQKRPSWSSLQDSGALTDPGWLVWELGSRAWCYTSFSL